MQRTNADPSLPLRCAPGSFRMTSVGWRRSRPNGRLTANPEVWNKQMQMLRCAQHDSAEGSLKLVVSPATRQLPVRHGRRCTLSGPGSFIPATTPPAPGHLGGSRGLQAPESNSSMRGLQARASIPARCKGMASNGEPAPSFLHCQWRQRSLNGRPAAEAILSRRFSGRIGLPASWKLHRRLFIIP